MPTPVLLLADRTPQPATAVEAVDFQVQTIDGGSFRLSEQHGHMVGVFAMASWCGTCIPEAQAWERLLGEYGPRGLTVVGISGDPGDTPDDIRQFAAVAKVQRLIFALDPKGEFVRQFQVRSLDTTFIFNREGRRVYQDFIPSTYTLLRAEIEKIL